MSSAYTVIFLYPTILSSIYYHSKLFWLCHICRGFINCLYTGSSKKNLRILLFNILVNWHVLVRFILKYVRTLKVLSSPVLHSASVTVTVNSNHCLCSGIHIMLVNVRWHPFDRKLSVCCAYFKSVVTIQCNCWCTYGTEARTDI